MNIEGFKIEVRNENYSVEPIDLGSEIQYKISTDCNYIMTIHRDDNGGWSANKDVLVMDEDLVTAIGESIEANDA